MHKLYTTLETPRHHLKTQCENIICHDVFYLACFVCLKIDGSCSKIVTPVGTQFTKIRSERNLRNSGWNVSERNLRNSDWNAIYATSVGM